jgi:hypothetical protein
MFFAARVQHRALARGGLFHLGPHRVQIVRSRDYREQQYHGAAQRQQTLQRSHSARDPRFPAPPPKPKSRQRQQHPREIKQQFHTEITRLETQPSVFQKLQIQVNMTIVPLPQKSQTED